MNTNKREKAKQPPAAQAEAKPKTVKEALANRKARREAFLEEYENQRRQSRNHERARLERERTMLGEVRKTLLEALEGFSFEEGQVNDEHWYFRIQLPQGRPVYVNYLVYWRVFERPERSMTREVRLFFDRSTQETKRAIQAFPDDFAEAFAAYLEGNKLA